MKEKRNFSIQSLLKYQRLELNHIEFNTTFKNLLYILDIKKEQSEKEIIPFIHTFDSIKDDNVLFKSIINEYFDYLPDWFKLYFRPILGFKVFNKIGITMKKY